MKTKILYWLGCLFLAITFASCSDDDDSPSASRLKGTWELIYFEEWETKNDEYDHQLQIDYTTVTNSQVITFYEDGTLKNEEVNDRGEHTFYGTWAIKGSTFWWDDSGEYERDDNYKIVTLNKSTFIFEDYFTEFESGDKWTFYQKYTFQRISED
jgi:hypothetical protein